MQQILSVQELFTGEHWISEAVIVIENGKVTDIKKEGYDHKNAMPLIVPALIDLQIYGADEKLLSEFPTADTIQKIYDYCVASGTGLGLSLAARMVEKNGGRIEYATAPGRGSTFRIVLPVKPESPS